jgi:hypothetical protein
MTTKEKVRRMVDRMPEQSLAKAEELLEELYWTPIIENATDPEELRIIAEGNAAYEADPSSYIPLDEFLKSIDIDD